MNNVGGMAARMQARTGNSGLFATAQQVAMGGAIPTFITAIGASMGAVSGAVAGSTYVGVNVASVGMGAASAIGAGIGTAAASVAGMGAAAVAAAAAAL